ncbi:MAG: SDR family NAD(P)-dependent oxidoreductase, partial [Bacteroidota bacterium]
MKSLNFFDDRVVLITGSAQGIGFALAEALARQGASVVLNARRPHKVEQAKNKLLDLSNRVDGLAGDVSDEAFARELVAFTVHRFGRLDYLINNAGIAAGGLLQETQGNAFRKVIE